MNKKTQLNKITDMEKWFYKGYTTAMKDVWKLLKESNLISSKEEIKIPELSCIVTERKK